MNLLTPTATATNYTQLFIESGLCIYIHFCILVISLMLLNFHPKFRSPLMRKRCWESWWFMSALVVRDVVLPKVYK